MLPFLMAKRPMGSIMATHKAEGGLEDHGREEEVNPELLSHAEDMIRAMHSKDAHALALALEAAFHCLDSGEDEEQGEMPEEEGA